MHNSLYRSLAILAALLAGTGINTPASLAQTTPVPPGSIRVDGRILGESAPPAPNEPPLVIPDFRNAMRDMIVSLGEYAHTRDSHFIVLVRQGLGSLMKSEREAKIERMTLEQDTGPVPPTPEPAGTFNRRLVQSLDGVVVDGQFCTEEPTASPGFIAALHDIGLNILTIDHCGTSDAAEKALRTAQTQRIVAHTDSGTGPLAGPGPMVLAGNNPQGVNSLAQATNALFVEGNSSEGSKELWLIRLRDTNHDVLVIDPFWRDRIPLSAADVASLRLKQTGSRRLVLARLHLSQAADTRYYWNNDWKINDPKWLTGPVPGKPGTYVVAYWEKEWRELVGKMFNGMMDLGFDGIVLEGADAYAPMESKIFIK